MLCSVQHPGSLTSFIPMEADTMVLLRKPYFLRNRRKKSELIQKVPIYNSRNFRKTTTVYPHADLRCVYSHPRFNGLTCTECGYITWWCVTLTPITKLVYVMLSLFFKNIKHRFIPQIYILEKNASHVENSN